MLTFYLKGNTIFIVFVISYILMVILKLFKFEISKKTAIYSEFFLMGFGLVLRRKPFAAFVALLLSFIPKLVYIKLHDEIITNIEEGYWILAAILFAIVVLATLFVIRKTIRYIQIGRFTKPVSSSGSSYSSYDDRKEREIIRDHMEYHHHNNDFF